jgi:hypothetical protein
VRKEERKKNPKNPENPKKKKKKIKIKNKKLQHIVFPCGPPP